MNTKRIRIGIIGAGGNTTKFHLPGFRAQEGVEIVTVANRTRASSQRVADEFSIGKIANDWQEIIEDPSIDAVCIGTWPYMHAPMTILALENGKHVLCEARMASNAVQAHEMLAASRRAPRCIAQIVPAPHTLEFDKTIIEMISAGYIGDLIALDARIALGSDFPNPNSPTHWRHDRIFSGNNIMTMGIWYEAFMRWVGPMACVYASGQSVVAHRINETGHRVPMMIPDHLDIIGKMEQGGQMRLNVSTVLGHAPANTDVCIFGTNGTLRLHRANGEPLILYGGQRGEDSPSEILIDPLKKGGWRVEEEFISAIRGSEEVTHTDFPTAVKYMEWTDAVSRSLRTGKSIGLPLMV